MVIFNMSKRKLCNKRLDCNVSVKYLRVKIDTNLSR